MKKIKPNFVYPEIKETDYVFGGGQIQGAVLNLDRDWRPFTPPFEEQRRNGLESSTCFIHALQHTIATLLEKTYGIKDQNFSERYNHIFTEATPQGGDPLKAAQSFRDKGLIPDEMLPFSSNLRTWQEFRSFKGGDRAKCEAEGKRWRAEWSPRYDIVVTREMDVKNKYSRLRDALLYSPCPVSVAQGYDNGLSKPKGLRDIHLVELLHIDDAGRPTILDTYYPFLKTLAPYYDFDFGMRQSIQKTAVEEVQIGIIKKLINALLELIGLVEKETPTPAPNVAPEPPQPQPELPKSRIVDWAKAIEKFENAPKSWNNPGAIRSAKGPFLVFPTYKEGFEYLCDYLTRACTGKHKAYKPDFTLERFFKTYAPASDGNDPIRYASFVASQLGIATSTKIKDLI